MLMCVSPDKDWIKYAAESKNLLCMSSLNEALALFNEPNQHHAEAFVNGWLQTDKRGFYNGIFSAIQSHLRELDYDIQVSTNEEVHIEVQPLYVELFEIPLQSFDQPTVIAIDEETVTFNLQIEAFAEIRVIFNFYLSDRFNNRVEAGIGPKDSYAEEAIPIDLTITAKRSLEGSPKFKKIEIAKKDFEIYFVDFVDSSYEFQTQEKPRRKRDESAFAHLSNSSITELLRSARLRFS